MAAHDLHRHPEALRELGGGGFAEPQEQGKSRHSGGATRAGRVELTC
jgi:hypothetical protein